MLIDQKELREKLMAIYENANTSIRQFAEEMDIPQGVVNRFLLHGIDVHTKYHMAIQRYLKHYKE